MRVVALLVIAACWTGTPPEAPPPVAPPHVRATPYPLEVTMIRTRCREMPCESYEVRIAGDGTVRWRGQVRGPKSWTEVVMHVPRRRIQELDRAIDRVHFFELDAMGRLPSHLEPCGPGQLCAFALCGFPAHAEVTVRRGGDSHAIDDELCGASTAASPLEDLIDEIASTPEWLVR